MAFGGGFGGGGFAPMMNMFQGVTGFMGSMMSGRASAANAMMQAQSSAWNEQAAAVQSRWNAKVAEQMSRLELERAAATASDSRFRNALQVIAPLRARMAQSGFEYSGSLPMALEAVHQQSEFGALRQGWEGDVASSRQRTAAKLEKWKANVHDTSAAYAMDAGHASASNIMNAAMFQGFGSLLKGASSAYTTMAGQQPVAGFGGTGGYAPSTPVADNWNKWVNNDRDWSSPSWFNALRPTDWYTSPGGTSPFAPKPKGWL